MSPLTIVLADDHPAVRKSLRVLIESERTLEVIAEAGDGLETIRTVQALQPDLLVLDIKMPLMTGLEVLQYLRNQKQPVGIIILSNHSEQLYVAAALRLGADAFVTKSDGVEALMEAIRIVGQRVSGERTERPILTGSTRGGRRRADASVSRDRTNVCVSGSAEKSA